MLAAHASQAPCSPPHLPAVYHQLAYCLSLLCCQDDAQLVWVPQGPYGRAAVMLGSFCGGIAQRVRWAGCKHTAQSTQHIHRPRLQSRRLQACRSSSLNRLRFCRPCYDKSVLLYLPEVLAFDCSSIRGICMNATAICATVLGSSVGTRQI